MLPVAVLAGRAATDTSGLNNQGPDGFPEVTCAAGNYTEIYLSAPPPVSIGKYYTTKQISIEGVGKVHVSSSSGPNQPCLPMIADLTDARWQLVSKPAGSAAVMSNSGFFNGKFTPDIDGTYVVRWTVCPNFCRMTFPGLTPFDVEGVDREATFVTASELPFPPQTDVAVPPYTDGCGIPGRFPCNQQSDFPPSVRDFKCDGGGGVFDPQWVTVGNWDDVFDYELLEGTVQKSRVSRKDSPMNHHSQDANFKVLTDPGYRYLVSTDPEDSPDPQSMGVEWEVDDYPNRFRPTIGDRVSVWGYWIHDCGHEPYFTEIHPAVGVAVHRPRPVPLPESLGLGSNVFAPGVVSDVWFNRNAGEITDNCSWTGLHQPSPPNGDETCLPEEGGGPNPIAGRGYAYNIYLPPNPQDVLREAGHDSPPNVELYYEAVGFPAGREPSILVIETGEITYLHVEIDLVGYTGDQYDGRIVAAWQYPAPDNWGMKQYQVEITSLDVHDDSDITCHDFYCPIFIGGDPRMWVNIPNIDQEWTRILNCDECIFDESTHSFGGNPWRTGGASGRNLGPHVNLFPGQLFRLSMSGYDDDWIETSDDVGYIYNVFPPPEQGTYFGWPNNMCSDSSPEIEVPVAGTDIAASHCADYNVNWKLIPLGVINASLTPTGQALYDSLLVNVSDLGCQALVKIVCWDDKAAILDFAQIHPNGMHPDGPKVETDLGSFTPQGIEDFTWADIHPSNLKGEFLRASQAEINQFFAELLPELGDLPQDHPMWEIVVLEAVLPPGLFEQHLGHLDFLWPVWGDANCDEKIDEMDFIPSLLVSARIKPGAPCVLQANANCDTAWDVKDTIMIMRFAAGLPTDNLAGGPLPDDFGYCGVIGEEVHLDIPLPSTTPVPSTTAPPSVTPTGTATPTTTGTATVTPTATPDVTGPTITNVADDPDPIDDGPGNCPNEEVTIVSASIHDPSGLDSVILHYRLVDNNVPAAWHTLSPLFVSGTTWQIQLNPPDNTDRIDWYWEAIDNASNSTLEPANAPTSVYDTTVLYCD